LDQKTEREKAKIFTDLIVWQKAHKFVIEIYNYTGTFPKNEMYGLIQQMRRSAVSIPANIAEGFKKRTNIEKKRFYNIAQGSIEETRYYLILSKDLGYGENNSMLNLLEEVSKLLEGYSKNILLTPDS